MGFIYQMQQFQEERLWAAAHAIQALADNCIQQTIEYARERQDLRQARARPPGRCHFKLAELQDRGRGAARAGLHATASSTSPAQDVTELASMAKLKAGRLGRIVPDTCLQFWGGMGYTWENPVSRTYRDGRARLDRRRRRRGDAGHHRQVHGHRCRRGLRR